MKGILYSALILTFCLILMPARAAEKTVVLDGATFTHKIAVANGITIHYVIGGKGEPILLLHGYPETWYDWRKVMPVLSLQYTVIAPDMRGLGDSTRPADGDYTKKSVADDLYKLVQSLGYKQVNLVAQDMGGPVAVAYAAAHPEAVRKMVIVEFGVPGYGLESAMDTAHGGSWHFGLFADTETALLLTKRREKEFFTQWAFRGNYVVDKSTFTDADIREYVRHYAAPGGMAAGFWLLPGLCTGRKRQCGFVRASETDVSHFERRRRAWVRRFHVEEYAKHQHQRARRDREKLWAFRK